MEKREGLDGRQRDEDGEIRRKNGNTLIRTVRATYGEEFALGRRSDMKLENYLADEGYPSLTAALKDHKKRS
jgi:hypothetical protein